ncbi:MAG: hypothetical protein V4594_00120 [Bacteroidota bacterium]
MIIENGRLAKDHICLFDIAEDYRCFFFKSPLVNVIDVHHQLRGLPNKYENRPNNSFWGGSRNFVIVFNEFKALLSRNIANRVKRKFDLAGSNVPVPQLAPFFARRIR